MISKAFRHVRKHGLSSKQRDKIEEGDGIRTDGSGHEKDPATGHNHRVDSMKEGKLAQNGEANEHVSLFGEMTSSNDSSKGGTTAGDKHEQMGNEDEEERFSVENEDNMVLDSTLFESIKTMDDGVTKGGYLKKRGRGRNGLTGSLHKPWTTRFITVNTELGVLRYYDNENDIQKQKLPKGQLYISEAKLSYTIPPSLPSSSSPVVCEFAITVTKTTGKIETLQFAAIDEKTMRAWIHVLTTVCKDDGAGRLTVSAIEVVKDDNNTNSNQMSATCASCGFEEIIHDPSSSSLSSIQYCCSSCGSFQIFDVTPIKDPEKEVDEAVAMVQQSSEESRNRLDTSESFNSSVGDCLSVKSRDSFELLTLTQMMAMDKDDLMNEVKRHNKEDIVEVLVSVRNRLSSVGSPSSSSSFAASTILSGKSLWGVTDESIQDDQNSPQHSLYMIGKESVNKKTFDDYNNLMKMNVRLLKTMCLKTLSEDEVPTDKHTMTMYLLRNTIEDDSVPLDLPLSSNEDSHVTLKIPLDEIEDETEKNATRDGVLKGRDNEGNDRKGLGNDGQRLKDFTDDVKYKDDLKMLVKDMKSLKTQEKRAKSAPARYIRNDTSSNRKVKIYTKASLPSEVNFSKPTLRSSITSIYYFKEPLNIDDLPQSTREFQHYAKLSKLADVQLQQELINRNLFGYKFRSPHEAKMAIVQANDINHGEDTNADGTGMRTRLNYSQLTKELGVDFSDHGSTADSSLSSDDTLREKEKFTPRTFSITRRRNISSDTNVAVFKKVELEKGSQKTPETGIVGFGGYYYDKKLTYQLPTKTKEYIEYGKLSKMSVLALSKQLEKCNLHLYKFRNSHESVMAIISHKMKHEEERKNSVKNPSPTARRSVSTGSFFLNRKNSSLSPSNKLIGKAKLAINIPPHSTSSSSAKGKLMDRRLHNEMNSIYKSTPFPPSTPKKLNDLTVSTVVDHQSPSFYSLQNDSTTKSSSGYANGMSTMGSMTMNRSTRIVGKKIYFFKNKLTESHPVSSKQSIYYGKFARMSSLGIDVELNKRRLGHFEYRNDHEKIMAMISAEFNAMIALRNNDVIIQSVQTKPFTNATHSTGNGGVNYDLRGRVVQQSNSPHVNRRGQELQAISTSELATKLRMHKISPEKFAYNRELMLQALMNTEQNKIAGLFRKKSNRIRRLDDENRDDHRQNDEQQLQLTTLQASNLLEAKQGLSSSSLVDNKSDGGEDSSDSEDDIRDTSSELHRRKLKSHQRFQQASLHNRRRQSPRIYVSHEKSVSRDEVNGSEGKAGAIDSTGAESGNIGVEDNESTANRKRTESASSALEFEEVHQKKVDAYRRLTTPSDEWEGKLYEVTGSDGADKSEVSNRH